MSIRIEGKTAHVKTVAEAMRAASLPGVEDVVIEDNTERIRMQRFIKAMEQVR